MMKEELIKLLKEKVKPYCDTHNEMSAVQLYLETDKYRKKLLDFITISEEKKEIITKDQFMILLVELSNEEEKEIERSRK